VGPTIIAAVTLGLIFVSIEPLLPRGGLAYAA
jgi:hypothetical protein